MVLGPNRFESLSFSEPDGRVRAPPRDNVVAHSNVIALTGPAKGGDDRAVDLFFRESVYREASCYGNEGFNVEVAREAEGGGGRPSPASNGG